MAVLLAFAFVAGLATVAAPCVLPLLPVVLAAGAMGGDRRPLGVVVGLVISFAAATLFLSLLVINLGFQPDILRQVAAVVLLVMGLIMLIPALLGRFEGWISRVMPKAAPQSDSRGFRGGLTMGLALGLIWTPCTGPIMAAVITLAASGGVTLTAVLITVAFALGAGVPLLALAYGGQAVIRRSRVLASKAGLLQRVFGVIMIATGLIILFGVDRTLQSSLVEALPERFQNGFTSQLEESSAIQDELERLQE